MVNLHSHATRLGVLDIGSNTVHMLIVDAAPGARPEPEASAKGTVRLMQYLKEDGTIKKAGVEAVISAVEKAMELAKEYEITQLLVLATSALREAPNGGKILRRIEDAIGQPVTVLSGVDEARLTFLAARRWYGWDAGRLLVIDIGGGSLEVAMGSDEDPTVALSVVQEAAVIVRPASAVSVTVVAGSVAVLASLALSVTSYSTFGSVEMRSRPNSRSRRSRTISRCSMPRNPTRNPKPRAADVSGS